MSEDNTNLNLNRARADKFTLVISDIPSSQLLVPPGIEQGSKSYFKELLDDKNRFYLSLKAVELPGMSIGEEKIPTMFSPLSVTNMVYAYDPLTTTFRLDESYQLYQMFVLWLHMIKNPEGFNQHHGVKTFQDTVEMGSIIVKGNMKNAPDGDYTAMMMFDFIDLRPMSISSLSLDYSDEGTELQFTVTWMYSYWIPRKYNGDPFDITLTSA